MLFKIFFFKHLTCKYSIILCFWLYDSHFWDSSKLVFSPGQSHPGRERDSQDLLTTSSNSKMKKTCYNCSDNNNVKTLTVLGIRGGGALSLRPIYHVCPQKCVITVGRYNMIKVSKTEKNWKKGIKITHLVCGKGYLKTRNRGFLIMQNTVNLKQNVLNFVFILNYRIL